MTESHPKRLIEVAFPLREVSAESREKRQISGIHMWWARRPPTACRAALFAQLVLDPDDQACPPAFRSLVEELVPLAYDFYDREGPHPPLRRRLLGFVADLCKWDNSNNQHLLDIARRLIREANGGTAPKVLDPFAGGGAIPLEALRLGCEVCASELNPVAVLILKCTVEYPQKYGQADSRPVPDYIHEMDRREANATGRRHLTDGDGSWAAAYRRNPLATDVRYWGQWVLERAREQLAPYYPPDPDGKLPVAYFWARTVKCPNPACGAQMPLIRQYRLSRKGSKSSILQPLADQNQRSISFRVLESTGREEEQAIQEATATGRSVSCVFCGQPAKDTYVKEEGKAGRLGGLQTSLVLDGPRGKEYRAATPQDYDAYTTARSALNRVVAGASDDLSPAPNEPIFKEDTRHFTPPQYGLDTFGKLFNDRQLLALITFARLVRSAHEQLAAHGVEAKYARAIVTYLALAVGKLADYNSMCCFWHVSNEQIARTFNRQAIQMVWDSAEANPLSGKSGSWDSMLRDQLRSLLAGIRDGPGSITIESADAARLAARDGIYEVATDPPYYDYVAYSDLADYFYVWHKRSVGDLYPDLFATPLTPKGAEITENPYRNGRDAKNHYRELMAKAFAQLRRSAAPRGICTIVFAHTQTSAWDALVESLIGTGFQVTASWPIRSEMKMRLRAQGTASLESSIFLVCRPRRADGGVAYLHEVSEELRSRIRERLDYFWAQGIRGADFFVSAIGPALEVYSRHAEVRTTAGDAVTVVQFLELVRSEVIDYALSQVLGAASLGAVDNETRFYVLWRWAYGAAPLEAGEVITFVKPLGVELDELVRDGIVSKKRSKINLKSAADRTEDEDLGLPRAGLPAPIVDCIHRCLNLWRANRRQELADYLATLGEARVEIVKRCAQALSEVLREDDPERRDLHAMLTGGLEPSMRRML